MKEGLLLDRVEGQPGGISAGPVERAAAIEALRFHHDPSLLELIPEIAAKLPTKKVARAG